MITSVLSHIVLSLTKRLSLFAWLLISAILVFSAIKYHKVFEKETNIITYDIYGYYLYLPALITYHDTKEFEFVDEHFEKYKISATKYQLNKIDDGIFVPIYTSGLAILYSPFYLLTDTFVRYTRWTRDGMSFPYQLSTLIATLFYAIIGLWWLKRYLLLFYSECVTSIVLFVLGIGTNYYHYVCVGAGMPHAIIFAIYSGLLLLIHKWYKRPSILTSILVSLSISLVCLSRPSEVVIVLFFMFYEIRNFKDVKNRLVFFKREKLKLFIIVITGVLCVLPQMIYWKENADVWIYNGYVGHHFDFLAPHIFDGLFSFRKGWLIYTPSMIFALIGFILVYKNKRAYFFAYVLFVTVNIYVVYSWHIWWYSSSFGARAMVQSYAMLAFPLGAFFSFTLNKSKKAQVFIFSILLFFILLNQFQAWQYREKILPEDEVTKTYYLKVFGATSVVKDNLKYLDIDEVLPQHYKNTKAIQEYKSNNIIDEVSSWDTVLPSAFSKSIALEVDLEFLQGNTQWVRAESMLKVKGSLFGVFNIARLCFQVSRDEESIKWTGVRFQRFVPEDRWYNVNYDVSLPSTQIGDRISVCIWNNGPDTVLVKKIKLYAYY